jgi:soluble lytic murein transglycosylase-like protein
MIRIAVSAVALLLGALAGAAAAREVVVPLTLDHAFVRQLLVRQVFTEPGPAARVWDDRTGCNFLLLRDPRVDAADGRLRIVAAGQARVGTAVGRRCLVVLDWTGFVEVFQTPALTADGRGVTFRVVDSNLYDDAWQKRLASGVLWDWTKAHVHPRLAALRVDLTQPLAELRAFLPLVLAATDRARVEALLASLGLAAPAVVPDGLTLRLRFSVDVAAPAPSPVAEPTLTPDELARFTAAWQHFDAFLTFVAQHSAADTALPEVRSALLGVLLHARYDILDALAPRAPPSRDPTRRLFVRTWKRLAPVLRSVQGGLPAERALHYLSFVAAADALRALDELGPSVGVEVSANGLRRLARMLAPAAAEDPLFYSDRLDPALRELFGFGPPLPAPQPNPDVDLSRWWPLWMAVPAWAAAADPVARLNRWIPAGAELNEYLPLVRELLRAAADRTLAAGRLDAAFQPLYRTLVLATAWQESCWRQFVRHGGSIRPIRSSAGAVGIMQVNQRVWRGFYDVAGLQRDIAYNAGAGAEILRHYLADYAVAKGEHTKTGNVDNLARATYAVYNGGPGHLRRYRNPKGRRSLRAIDEAFWRKYQTVQQGQEMAVASCWGHQ